MKGYDVVLILRGIVMIAFGLVTLHQVEPMAAVVTLVGFVLTMTGFVIVTWQFGRARR